MLKFGIEKNKGSLIIILTSIATTLVMLCLIGLIILPSLYRKIEQKNSTSSFLNLKTGLKEAGVVEQQKDEDQIKMRADNATTESLVKKVFSHIFLPKGDIRVESITKPDDLRKIDPIFYQYAKVGDIVLTYTDRAILYDPAADKVLDVLHIVK